MVVVLNRFLHFLMGFSLALGIYHPATLEAISRSPGDILAINGNGWGHGVGMCQEGARGMAASGFTSDQIIKHFYTGVEKGNFESVRVRIILIKTRKPIRICPSDGFSFHSTTGKIAEGKAGELWTVDLNGDRFEVNGPKESIKDIVPPLKIVPEKDGIARVLNLRFTRYRGTVILDIDRDMQTIVINDLPIDQYLYGVVPSEVPGGWPSEALKAQSIVARCYALRNLERHNLVGSGGRTIKADLCNGPHCQVFKGFNIETDKARKAVDETSGVVYIENKVGQVIDAFFHACCGGHTENVENVWGGQPVSYLKGVKDPYCATARTFRWKRLFSFDQIRMIFAKDARTALRGIWDIRVDKRGDSISRTGSPRAIALSIYGEKDEKRVKASVFKGVLNEWAPRLFPRVFPGSGPQTINDTLFYLSMPPVITDFSVPVKYFSPNGDGVLDSGKISIKIPNKTDLNLTVKSGSRTVRELHKGIVTGGISAFIWDGKDDSNLVVSEGKYLVSLTASGLGGAKSVRDRLIVVDLSSPQIKGLNLSTTSFNPQEGGLCEIGFSFEDKISNRMLLKVVLRNATGGILRSWRWNSTAGGKRMIVWDGKGDDGEIGQEGEYVMELFVRDLAGNSILDRSQKVILR